MKRWIFRLLTLSAIIFAAGISGAWLADQFTAPLPWAWGFFGAIIIGVAIYGGVALGTHGDRTGYLIAGLGAVAEITFGFWYFAHAHGIFTALVLGIVPTGIAIMSGLVENAADVMDAQAEQEADERAWEREQARLRLDMEHAEKLARIEANAQARIEKARIDAESQTQPADAPPPTQHATRPAAGTRWQWQRQTVGSISLHRQEKFPAAQHVSAGTEIEREAAP